MPFHRCTVCGGVLYDSTDAGSAVERTASISCLMCGRIEYGAPPSLPSYAALRAQGEGGSPKPRGRAPKVLA
jgi:hypothetical protein